MTRSQPEGLVRRPVARTDEEIEEIIRQSPVAQVKSGKNANWKQCGVCDADFTNWFHRANHFKKNHPNHDAKTDYT